MNFDRKLWLHFVKERRAEEEYLRAYAVDDATRFVYIKLKELYWTVSRFFGFVGPRGPALRGVYCERPKLTDEQMEGAASALKRPRVLIDVTLTHRFERHTGIQRAIREMSRLAFEDGRALPVIVEGGRLRSYFDHPSLPSVIDVGPGDKFLMADSSWELLEEYLPVLAQVSAQGGEVIVCLYDIIPLLHPLAVSPEGAELFSLWFEKIVLKSDVVMCISEWTATTFKNYITKNSCQTKQGQRIGWWRLGADFQLDTHQPPSSRAVGLASRDSPFFLSVGTLEPRKGYSIALAAFEKLWNDNVDVRYVIVGRQGGRAKALEARITSHAEYGRRLIWVNDANDADLCHYYTHARALIYASVIEGFGLPLVEAQHHGLPAIVSDLPVFRDIGGEQVCYFDLLDEESLAAEILRAIQNPRPKGAVTPTYTWRESINCLLDMINDDTSQLGVPRSPDKTSPLQERGSRRLSLR